MRLCIGLIFSLLAISMSSAADDLENPGVVTETCPALDTELPLATEYGSAGIMKNLPVDFRLADTCGTYDGAQNVCAPDKCEGDAQCTSLLSWYVFLPACVQANSVLPEPVAAARPAYVAPARPLW